MYSKTGKKEKKDSFICTPSPLPKSILLVSATGNAFFTRWYKHTFLPPDPSPLPSTSVMQINIASLVVFKFDSLAHYSDSTQKRA